MIDTERIATYQQLLTDVRNKKVEVNKEIDSLFTKLASLKVEEKSIEKLLYSAVDPSPDPKPKRKLEKTGKYTKNRLGQILALFDTGEFSVAELCEKFGMDSDSARSYFSMIYRQHRLGRRSFATRQTYQYKYATERWYKSQGITDYALHKNWVSEA